MRTRPYNHVQNFQVLWGHGALVAVYAVYAQMVIRTQTYHASYILTMATETP
jgi:hypothetical protein